MKLSRYTIIVEDYPEPGRHIAYNTRSQGLAVVNDRVRTLLAEMPLAAEAASADLRTFLYKLEELGITASDDADELDLVRDWFQTIRYNAKKLEAYILTTYYCNFACPYCFEGKEKVKKYLSQEKAAEIVAWMKQKAMEVHPEKVEVVFFGGEPLLNIPMVEYIARELHGRLAATPWHFEFSIITNGALVSEALVDRLNPLGLKSLRITIDGAKEFHDRYRPFLSGKGTFDLILRNIKAVAGKTKVVLAGNFNAASYESLYRLLDDLESAGLREKIAQVDFKPITETREQQTSNAITAPTYSCDAGHADKMLALKKELMRRGFKTAKALDGGGICHFKAADHQVIIDTDGLIFKCPAMVGEASKACGDVAQGTRLDARYEEFMAFDLAEWKGKCRDCRYLPFCAGGCNYHAELQTGSYKNVFCEKDFFDRTIREYIKLRYEQALAKKKPSAIMRHDSSPKPAPEMVSPSQAAP